jgi:hypothetical protein
MAIEPFPSTTRRGGMGGGGDKLVKHIYIIFPPAFPVISFVLLNTARVKYITQDIYIYFYLF